MHVFLMFFKSHENSLEVISVSSQLTSSQYPTLSELSSSLSRDLLLFPYDEQLGPVSCNVKQNSSLFLWVSYLSFSSCCRPFSVPLRIGDYAYFGIGIYLLVCDHFRAKAISQST